MNTPPPQNVCTDIPDYYLGCLIYFDEFSEDNCRWVVFDGHSKIRCTSRKSAIEYITTHKMNKDDETRRYLFSARLHINHAHEDLDRAARLAMGADRLIFEQLSVKLRPFLVDLDNQLLI